jgi:hypothetical protein
MGNLLQRWLRYFDPLYHGRNLFGVASGSVASNGFFFSRIRGGYHLRRLIGGVPSLDDSIVGAAGADGSSIREFPWVTHSPDSSYTYRLTAVCGGGVEEDGTCNLAVVDFDSNGDWVGLRPRSPEELRVAPAAGGRFTISWSYFERGQQVAPVLFRVFADDGDGVVDYDVPIGEVAYRFRQTHFSFLSSAHAHGARRTFAVRAVSSDGIDDGNTMTAFAFADVEGPALPEGVVLHIVAADAG